MEWLGRSNRQESNDKIPINEYFDIGNSLKKLGRYQDAIDWYDKILEIDLNHINSLNNKGDALTNLGKFDEAEACFEKIWDIQKIDHETCQMCKNTNPKDSLYCNKCGNILNSSCSKCGEINQEGSSFCNFCGFTLQ